VWDAWPILKRNGDHVRPDLWMALAAPWFSDPDERHAHARIHLIERQDGRWQPLGPAMPEGFSPGSREWSGSAWMEADGRTITLYFTAAGHRGEAEVSFAQRLFEAQATLSGQDGNWRLEEWRGLNEFIELDARHYMSPTAGQSQVGKIKAFRDPGYFHDRINDRHLVYFTASIAASRSDFNGAIGVAVADRLSAGKWEILPPIISADGFNNELERPHVVEKDGLYYLFWVTQSHVFDPQGPTGPTGLYGMVSDDLLSGWKPLNGSGLVIANPQQAPRQAYSWFVLPDLSVTSFVDDWGRPANAEGPRRFGGTFAPFLHLSLDGDRTSLIA